MTLEETLKYMESHLTEGWQEAWNRSKQILSKNGQTPTEEQILDYVVKNFYNGVAPEAVKEKYAKATANQQKSIVPYTGGLPTEVENKTTELANLNPQQASKEILAISQNNKELAAALLNQLQTRYPDFFAQLEKMPEYASLEALKNLKNATIEGFNEVGNEFKNVYDKIAELQNQLNQKPIVDENEIRLLEAPLTEENFEKNLKYFNDKLTDVEAKNQQLQDLISVYAQEAAKQGNPSAAELSKSVGEIKNSIAQSQKKSKSGFLGKLGQGLVKGANVLAGIAGSFIGNMAGGMGAAK